MKNNENTKLTNILLSLTLIRKRQPGSSRKNKYKSATYILENKINTLSNKK